MLNRPEILAPAGSKESLVAAVNAGADACYVGGDLYSARAFAGNFDKTDMLEAIDYCHINNVKLYMAVNTLLKNEEIGKLVSYIEPFYKEGIDGIIVQDTGVFKLLSEEFPDLPMHGSTQMSICDSSGAAFLKEIGFSRLVLARELSFEEIKKIKKDVDIEIEAFVHGAMCFSYSGKCLLSSFAGGRSGNRGRCAQPCRKAYSGKAFNGEYALSMKDMCMLKEIPNLIDAGISSFKIEGRMKKPEYVALATRAYSDITDAYLSGSLNDNMIKDYNEKLLDIYNRGGFSTGYYYTGCGKEMLANKRPNHTGVSVGSVAGVNAPDIMVRLQRDVNRLDVLEIRTGKEDIELTSGENAKAGDLLSLKGRSINRIKNNMPVYRTRNNSLICDINENIIGKEKKQKVSGIVTARIGEPLTLTLFSEYRNVSVKAYGEMVSAALKTPVSINQIMDKLKKTGGTGIRLCLEACVDENIFVPFGSLNKLKRDAIDELKRKIVESYRREVRCVNKKPDKAAGAASAAYVTEFCGFTVSVKTTEQLIIINKYKIVDNVIIDYNIIHDVDFTKLCKDRKYFMELPDVFREKSREKLNKLISFAKSFDGIVVKNIDELGFLYEINYDGKIICDSPLYAYNDFALAFYKERLRDVSFIGSVELTHKELSDLCEPVIEKIYGYQPVMVTAQCLKKSYGGGCGADGSVAGRSIISFADENNNKFYSVNYCGECYSVIYNGLPTDNILKISGDLDMKLICFTIEEQEAIEHVMEEITENASYKGRSTAGHYIKGIE